MKKAILEILSPLRDSSTVTTSVVTLACGFDYSKRTIILAKNAVSAMLWYLKIFS